MTLVRSFWPQQLLETRSALPVLCPSASLSSLSLLESSFSPYLSVFQPLSSLSLSFCRRPAENLMTASSAQPENRKFILVSNCNFSCFKINLSPLFFMTGR